MKLGALVPARASALDSERGAAALLRAHLHAMLAAQILDGVESGVVQKFRERWKEAIHKEAPLRYRLAGAHIRLPISFRVLWRTFRDAFEPGDYYRSARKLPARLADVEAWSFQTHAALEHWFDEDLVPEIRDAPRLTPTHVARIAEAFDRRMGLKPAAMVGRPGGTLWITCDMPVSERVAGFAGRVRDALGLFDRKATDYAFLVKLSNRMSSMTPMHAPTAFDAAGYPRFRPWPSAASAISPDTGRTYDLDTDERKKLGISHGREELVSQPRSLHSCEALIPIGHVGWDADGSTEACERYATEIEPRASARDLAARLDTI